MTLTGSTTGARLIPLDDRAAWEAALDGLPQAPAHTWAFRAALAASSDDPVWLLACGSDEGRFVCPIAERTFEGEPDAYTPYGFAGPVGVGDPTVLEAGLARVAADRGWVATYLGLHPVLAPDPLREHRQAVAQGTAHVFDLTLDEAELRRRLNPGHRRRIRDLPGLAASIGERSEAIEAFFVRTFPGFMAARGAGAAYGFSPASLEALCRLEQGTLLGLPADDPTAAALFTWTESGAEWNFGVRREEEGASLLPLIWTMVLRLKAAGRPWLNLGGGIRPGDGVEVFKERLGADRHPIVALRVVHRPDAYARLCRLAGVADTGAYFPAYRARGRADGDDPAQASSGPR